MFALLAINSKPLANASVLSRVPKPRCTQLLQDRPEADRLRWSRAFPSPHVCVPQEHMSRDIVSSDRITPVSGSGLHTEFATSVIESFHPVVVSFSLDGVRTIGHGSVFNTPVKIFGSGKAFCVWIRFFSTKSRLRRAVTPTTNSQVRSFLCTPHMRLSTRATSSRAIALRGLAKVDDAPNRF